MRTGYAPVMFARRHPLALLLALIVMALAGCGDDATVDDGGGGSAPAQNGSAQEQPSDGGSASTGESCADIPVPGHEAVGVEVQGVSCAQAAQVIAGAVGKGRRAYETAGFSCEPSEAGGGDTSYVCSQGDARVTFRYGAA